MATTITTTEPKVRPKGLGAGRGGGSRRGRDGGDGKSFDKPLPLATYRLGLWVGLASISMLFIGFTSAYVVRQGVGGDWRVIRMPDILWLTTMLLVGSSLTLELARRSLRIADCGLRIADWGLLNPKSAIRNPKSAAASPRRPLAPSPESPRRPLAPSPRRFQGWLTVTLLLGVVFLAGQLLAWRQLAAQGIFLGTSPHGSFFYLLTGTHGLHLLGGIIALTYVVFGSWRLRYTRRHHIAVDLTALYWHFMDGLWVYLFVLLFLWR